MLMPKAKIFEPAAEQGAPETRDLKTLMHSHSEENNTRDFWKYCESDFQRVLPSSSRGAEGTRTQTSVSSLCEGVSENTERFSIKWIPEATSWRGKCLKSSKIVDFWKIW